MKVLILLFLFLLPIGSSFSQENFQDYEFLVKAQTVVIENTQLVSLDFENRLIQVFTERPELLTDEDPTKMIEAIEELTSQGIPNRMKFKLSEAVRKPVVGLAHEIRTIVRKYGIATGITYATISITSYVVPVLLVAAGQPQLAALITAFPSGSVYLIGVVAFTKVVNHRKMIKLYGGKDQFHYYKKLHKQVNKSLHVKGKGSLIVPMEKNSEAEINALVLNGSNVINKFLSFIDHKRPKLDLRQLKYFLVRNEAWDQTLEKIKSSTASDELKTASMLHYIQVSNLDLYREIQASFPKSFIGINSFEFPQELKNWSLAAVHAGTKKELEETVALIPVGVRALDVVKIWVKCVVPHLIEESKGLPYGSYRSLSKSLMALEVSAERSPSKLVDETWRAEFYNYLQSALQK
jgi:hypothetical protein